jgi:xeroderma pigmentosum group C-complementing protein
VPARKQTLFDVLDAPSTNRSPDAPKALLSRLGGGDSDSELSSLSSSEPEFEDVAGPSSKRRKIADEEKADKGDSDDDLEFEDVETYGPQAGTGTLAPAPSGDLDLTLRRETRISLVNEVGKKQGPTKIERAIRVATHQMHVQFLMWHNSVRNRWICDREVQEILVRELRKVKGIERDVERWKRDSGLEVGGGQEEEVSSIGRGKGKATAKGKEMNKGKKIDERSQRDWGQLAQRASNGKVNMSHGDPLFALLKRLSSYWKQRFTITAPGLRKIGYMTLQRLDEEIKSNKVDYDVERHGERIMNRDEFKELAKKCEGSGDVGAQLFAGLLRGIGLETRMVVSLQPVGFGWAKNEDAAEWKEKSKSSKKKEEIEDSDEEEDAGGEPKPKAQSKSISRGKSKTKSKTPARRGSAQKPSTRTRGKGAKNEAVDISESENDEKHDSDDDSVVDITPTKAPARRSKVYEKDLAPNYWVEVLSPVTNKYVPVNPYAASDPVATNQELLLNFEPRGAKAEKAKQVMAYIIGFSSDGTAKDVTVRYLKRHMWPGKTKGFRFPVEKVPVYNSSGKVKRHEDYDWFKTVMSGYTRRDNQRTAVDDEEEDTDLIAIKPEKKEVKEGEETLQSYKASTEFVLERHLRREEALRPGAKHVKLFTIKGKGDATPVQEKVYLRSDVVNCKSMETWQKEGRAPIPGEQPLKRVPYRAATTNRKRELAEAELRAGGEKLLQPLYSYDQTDWIIPPPIMDGIIPKNAYGNMDVYVPSMVPEGAVHIPRRGTVRICKKLGIDYAEAVTGFEFGARMAIPIVTGVVVAEENAEMVLEQWRIDEAERLRKEDEKRRKAALGAWRKFLMGMRIVKRMTEEYGGMVDDNPDVLNPWTNRKPQGKSKGAHVDEKAMREIMDQREEDMAGGFFPEGHEEEEVPQSFFPTRHDHDDEGQDSGGGFMVEDDKPRSQPKGMTTETYPTPISTETNSRNLTIASEASEEEDTEMVDTEEVRPLIKSIPGAKGKAKALAKSPAIATRGQLKRKQTETPKSNAAPPAKHGRGRLKRQVSPEEEEEDEKEEPTEIRDSGDEEEKIEDEPIKATPRGRGKRKSANNLAKESPAMRFLPKRSARTKNATPLRSQYFEASEDEVDEE